VMTQGSRLMSVSKAWRSCPVEQLREICNLTVALTTHVSTFMT
jgi:hypothetical protein